MWFLLLANLAEGREYLLDPAVTSITLDGMLTIAATEIDLTAKDYVITVQLHNAGPNRLDLTVLTCGRGKALTPIAGARGQLVEVAGGETRTMQLLCDHGRMAVGDPSLRVGTVYVNPAGGTAVPAFENVVWRMREADIVGGRLRTGIQLATGAFDRVGAPPPLAVPGPAAEPGEPPVALAGNEAPIAEPTEPPVAAAPAAPKPPPPPPPAATLKPVPH